MGKYFGTDGIRGTVGKDPMTAEFALRLASAAARVLAPNGGRVVIGKDTRVSGYMFESALEAGFVAAGMDVAAAILEPLIIQPGKIGLVNTGFSVAIPAGNEIQVRPRSGLAIKHGITVVNAPGTIDADYRGDIGVILVNHGDVAFTVEDGSRIAQMVLAKYEQVEWEEVRELTDTDRGDGGFGSTGIK